MKREQVIAWAREAGFSQPWTAPKETQERLQRFAMLVADVEREQCAEIASEMGNWATAKIIRARNKT